MQVTLYEGTSYKAASINISSSSWFGESGGSQLAQEEMECINVTPHMIPSVRSIKISRF